MKLAYKRPHPIYRLVQIPLSSSVASWFFRGVLHYLDRPIMRWSNNRISLPAILVGLPVIMLTTTGAKSGKKRVMPVVGIGDGEKVVLIASYFGSQRHPAWYYNLRANPEATLAFAGYEGQYVAHEAIGAERERYWQMANGVYRGFEAYQRRTAGRLIPVLVLVPKDSV